MSIRDTIKKEFVKARGKGWKKIYVFVDLHECTLKPDWELDGLNHDYYPGAKELLQHLTGRKDIVLVMWTCSHEFEISQYIQNFKKDDIFFDYINENPEITTDKSGVGNTEKPKYGCYDKKPYYNVLLDDKAGCLPADLPSILEEFKLNSLE